MTNANSASHEPVDEFCARVIAAQAKLDGAWSQHRGLYGQLNRLKKQIGHKTRMADKAGSKWKTRFGAELAQMEQERLVLNDQIAGCEERIAAAETELAEAKQARDARWQTAVNLVKIFLGLIRQSHKESLKARDFEREKAGRAERKAAHKAKLKAAKEAKRQERAAEADRLEANRAARAAQIEAQQKAAQAKANKKHRHA